MVKYLQIHRVILVSIVALSLSACNTVKMPKIDLLKSPEFSEDAANIAKDYPKVKDAPSEPDDIRSAAQWDRDAKVLQNLRAKEAGFDLEPGPTAAESKAEFDALKAKVHAYKKDDPISGPVEGFPDYEPRR